MSIRIATLLATIAAAAAAAAFATPAQAELKWGAFKDNGCINPITYPGLRSKSAVLWGIPPGQSWEQTCAATGATIDGVQFTHPAVCVNTAAADPLASAGGVIAGGLVCSAGAAAIGLLGVDTGGIADLCAAIVGQGFEMADEVIRKDYYGRPARAIAAKARVKPWPFRLFGAVSAAERPGWKAKLAAAVTRNGVGQVKQAGGGLNIWGVFAVPDARCLPPSYITLQNASHARASQACTEAGARLCTQRELCEGGRPRAGQPGGDVWAAVGDRDNAWISIGTAYPERLCRTHTAALGSPPAWGTQRGPQPVTGKPTAFRCCR